MRFPIAVVVAALVVTACSGENTVESVPPETSAATTSTIDAAGLVAPCLLGETGFVDAGNLFIGDGVGDAGRIATIGWETHSGCDRIEFTFLTPTGAPASAIGRSVARLMPNSGVIRVEYPESVGTTGPSDVKADAGLVAAAYVVWTREGRLATDIHLRGERGVEFRADVAASPARSVVDVRLTDETIAAMPPIVSDDIVLITPTGGSAAYPIRITGYTRPAGGELVLRYTVDGELVEERRTVAAGEGSVWGEFSIVIDDGPAGAATLEVVRAPAVEPSIRVNLDVREGAG